MEYPFRGVTRGYSGIAAIQLVRLCEHSRAQASDLVSADGENGIWRQRFDRSF